MNGAYVCVCCSHPFRQLAVRVLSVGEYVCVSVVACTEVEGVCVCRSHPSRSCTEVTSSNFCNAAILIASHTTY